MTFHSIKPCPRRRADGRNVGRRWIDPDTDIALDALLAINTPARSAGAVTPPHTDNSEKLFAGLLYFAEPGDEGGGDLILYRRDHPPSPSDTKWPSASSLTEVSRVPYAANTLVLLLNSPWAVHGVSPRQPSPYPRRFVNFVAEAAHPLF